MKAPETSIAVSALNVPFSRLLVRTGRQLSPHPYLHLGLSHTRDTLQKNKINGQALGGVGNATLYWAFGFWYLELTSLRLTSRKLAGARTTDSGG